ncbi:MULTISPECIES: AAA family ATPase [Rhodococcus]|uniref:AAA family ATPase n=1 Tax=Nocardiaceae TaxID=85025 RepID=UPI000ACEBCCB|nr:MULTISPECIES: AAA family ATPase [Rhodococcus]
MKLDRIDVRFFRSFNYDFELKTREGSEPADWETKDPWYPFVRVPVERDITAIVGANEAGKSQLLTALRAALTGKPISREDFCRYSDEYSVQTGKIRLPEFGASFSLEETDQVPGVPALRDVRAFTLYRPGDGEPYLVINDEKVRLTSQNLAKLEAFMPEIYELKTGVAIPDSVSIAELTGESRIRLHDRRQRSNLFAQILGIKEPTVDNVGQAVLPSLASPIDEASLAAERQRKDEFELARTLLVDAARIDPQAFTELRQALASGKEGQVEAVVGSMNAAIRDNLNVQRWWTQDRKFELVLEAREHELAFTIQDRTGSTYSFAERSQGLRYFLSYFVQLSAHKQGLTKPDILLLDEPDAFLSSVGQQDLLRVLYDYALPENGSAGGQVVYVTHSPFLIDKNNPQRIRVLDKGAEDEGTRVVRDAANNRYEPLRSSLGTYVAETAFIGGQNLFVEGLADQVLIAGLSAHLSRFSAFRQSALNLNDVTIVAAGGADGIPYMAYLARGRDTIKPPCVALLDGDQSGRDAERVLKRGEARRKRVLQDKYIIRLDLWFSASGLDAEGGVVVEEIEDLLPVSIVHRAALNHLARFKDLAEVDIDLFSEQALSTAVAEKKSIWGALEATYSTAFEGEHIEKVGLAREIVLLLDVKPDVAGADKLRTRFAVLLEHLGAALDTAEIEEEHSRSDDRVKRAIKSFAQNYKTGITKRQAQKLIYELLDAFDRSDWVEQATFQLSRIRTEHNLQDSKSLTVEDFSKFREDIISLSTHEKQHYQDDAAKDPAEEVIGNHAAQNIPVKPDEPTSVQASKPDVVDG